MEEAKRKLVLRTTEAIETVLFTATRVMMSANLRSHINAYKAGDCDIHMKG